ncbi:ArsI/CadI family heavy metal resistance metalloenzyme [Acidovorax soli]|uniref:ArsI/CadI family heavy metal resistance metalloenzyme n=1 Tax=Acidovorax soli TaxID=592050 RepID=UPI000A856EF6|nr:ArsI/CadI family heavy metal resistance metalloenzyme [Acidovorax soli]
MKRMHVHIRVADLAHNISFYSALFNAEPAVVKNDYAKWMLEDPRINFAISSRTDETGLDHLGFQVDSAEELHEMNSRLAKAELPIETEEGAACCYAKSNKHWTVDPQGIAWESYQTLDTIPTFNEKEEQQGIASACCTPAPVATAIKPKAAAACCAPSSNKSSCC